MDVLTPEQRRRCMQANKGRGTKPERAFARLLWSSGIRYRKHQRSVPGTPDFSIKKYRLAIFIDGEFWHGRNWAARRETFSTNRQFWIAKIERNMARDRAVTAWLTDHGWKVFRFWESDVAHNPGIWIAKVLDYLERYRRPEPPTYLPSEIAAEPEIPYGESPLSSNQN